MAIGVDGQKRTDERTEITPTYGAHFLLFNQNSKTLQVLTMCIYVFHVIFTKNRYCFPTEH
jgi:hypothetical protein